MPSRRDERRAGVRAPRSPTALHPGDSRAWAGLANATPVSMGTAAIIEIVLTGRYETLFVWGIVAAAWLVCSLIDRARGRP
jgi:hypothetical protein